MSDIEAERADATVAPLAANPMPAPIRPRRVISPGGANAGRPTSSLDASTCQTRLRRLGAKFPRFSHAALPFTGPMALIAKPSNESLLATFA